MPDFRNQLPPARDQGDRGTCLCMAVTDGHQAVRGSPPALATDFLHFKATALAGVGVNDGVPEWAAMTALETLGQPAENDCPYSPNIRDPNWQPQAPEGPVWRHKTAEGPSDYWSAIAGVIEMGKPIVITMDIDDAFYDPVENSVQAVREPVRAAHAVLGIAIAANPDRVLVRNSWGLDWGDGGYAWLSRAYLDARCTGTIVFEGAVT